MSTEIEKKYPKIGVNVFVFNEAGKILMGKRIGKTGYGTWCLPGGHFEWGESLASGAGRELEEETSLVAESLEFLHIINDPIPSEKVHYVHINFLAKKWTGEPKVTEPDNFEKWEWFDLNNLPENMFIGHQRYVPTFLSKKVFVD
jgi:8-oxo-dGTP diphosphatase